MFVCECSGPLMGELKAGKTVTLDSGAVVSDSLMWISSKVCVVLEIRLLYMT